MSSTPSLSLSSLLGSLSFSLTPHIHMCLHAYMQQTTTELIKFGLEWGNPQNINHTWNFTFFGFLSAAQPSGLTIQKIWLFCNMLPQCIHFAKHLWHLIRIYACHFAGSWQNHSNNCFLCSAVVGWCERTSCHRSSIFNYRYAFVDDVWYCLIYTSS